MPEPATAYDLRIPIQRSCGDDVLRHYGWMLQERRLRLGVHPEGPGRELYSRAWPRLSETFTSSRTSSPTGMRSADPHGSQPVRDEGPHVGPGQITAPARDGQPDRSYRLSPARLMCLLPSAQIRSICTRHRVTPPRSGRRAEGRLGARQSGHVPLRRCSAPTPDLTACALWPPGWIQPVIRHRWARPAGRAACSPVWEGR